MSIRPFPRFVAASLAVAFSLLCAASSRAALGDTYEQLKARYPEAETKGTYKPDGDVIFSFPNHASIWVFFLGGVSHQEYHTPGYVQEGGKWKIVAFTRSQMRDFLRENERGVSWGQRRYGNPSALPDGTPIRAYDLRRTDGKATAYVFPSLHTESSNAFVYLGITSSEYMERSDKIQYAQMGWMDRVWSVVSR